MGNRIENCHLQGINIAPELYWLESGYSRNLKIEGKTVVNSGEEALHIHAIGSGSVFENILARGNCFETDFVPPVMYPASGVEITNNRINKK